MTSRDDTWFTPVGGGEGAMGFRDEPLHEVGGWKISNLVGEGGFGRVFLAYKGERRGALKVLRPDYVNHSNAEAFRKSFESEADILSQLGGPNTAELIDADLSGYSPWLVTRFVPGDTLAYQVKFENPVRGRAWWNLAYGLFNGLAEAHSKGIIHRDIKPSNVMRSADVPAIIIDFGIALLASSADIWNRAGTAIFQSPEQRSGGELTLASDIYSAALTLLYVTTKPTSPERQAFTRHEVPGVPFVDDVFDRTSVEASFLRTALALDPSGRPSADQMVEMCGIMRARERDSVNMAVPRQSSAPSRVFHLALPDSVFEMAVPRSRATEVTWSGVAATISRLLRVGPGQAARFGWLADDIEVSVFGLHTEHVVVEFCAPESHDRALSERMLGQGWAPPENAGRRNWLLVAPGGRTASARIGQAILGVVRDVLAISPSNPSSL